MIIFLAMKILGLNVGLYAFAAVSSFLSHPDSGGMVALMLAIAGFLLSVCMIPWFKGHWEYRLMIASRYSYLLIVVPFLLIHWWGILYPYVKYT